MPPNGHAFLSASAADRWLHCPPSARLCELYEGKGSDYAAEGTDIQSASSVRSLSGLLLHVFGRIAAALFSLVSLP